MKKILSILALITLSLTAVIGGSLFLAKNINIDLPQTEIVETDVSAASGNILATSSAATSWPSVGINFSLSKKTVTAGTDLTLNISSELTQDYVEMSTSEYDTSLAIGYSYNLTITFGGKTYTVNGESDIESGSNTSFGESRSTKLSTTGLLGTYTISIKAQVYFHIWINPMGSTSDTDSGSYSLSVTVTPATATLKRGTLSNVSSIYYGTSSSSQNTLLSSTSGVSVTPGTYYFRYVLSSATGYTYTFSSWTGSISGTGNPKRVTIKGGGITYTIGASATRSANNYTLTINPNGGSHYKNLLNGITGNWSSTNNHNLSISYSASQDNLSMSVTSTSDPYATTGFTANLTAGTQYVINASSNAPIQVFYAINLGYTGSQCLTFTAGSNVKREFTAPTTGTYNFRIDCDSGATGTYQVRDFWLAQKSSLTTSNIAYTYSYGSVLPLIEPTRTGYTFNGFTVTNGTTTYNKTYNSITMGTTTTLTANWTANKYAVTLNQNGGSGGTSSVTATYGSAMPTITKPSKAGFAFQGYYDTSATTGGTQYYTAAGASARSWDKTSATTLYARWTDSEAPIISRTTIVKNNDNSFYVYAYASDNVGLARVQFPTWTTANGQDDLVWHMGVNGSWNVNVQSYNYRYLVNKSDHNGEVGPYQVHAYAYDGAGNSISSVVTSSFIITQTVTLNQQGGSGGTTSVLATKDAAMPGITIPSKIGYNFQGYFTQTSGAGVQYYTATGTSAKNYDLDTTLSLYAYWIEKTWIDDEYVATSYASGTGTQTDPYIIKTAGQLGKLSKDSIGSDLNGQYFKLGANIDLSAHQWVPIGDQQVFKGTFDGGLYKISNLRITEGEYNYSGLFGRCFSISNIILDNVNITSGRDVGALAGGLQLIGQYRNCMITNANLSGARYVGGLAGRAAALNVLIENCIVKNSVIEGGTCGALIGDRLIGSSRITSCGAYNISGTNCKAINGNTSATINAIGVYSDTQLEGKKIYGGINDFGGFTYNANLNNGMPMPEGLFAIGGMSESEAVYIYLNVNLGFTPA